MAVVVQLVLVLVRKNRPTPAAGDSGSAAEGVHPTRRGAKMAVVNPMSRRYA
ncbi:MAG: hypothetical protein MUO58_08315 [Anaerolineales bacterium]|nr:hypothetical protein [Anaerolineales bacterium]